MKEKLKLVKSGPNQLEQELVRALFGSSEEKIDDLTNRINEKGNLICIKTRLINYKHPTINFVISTRKKRANHLWHTLVIKCTQKIS